MKKLIALLIFALLLFGCTEENKAKASASPTKKIDQPLIRFPSPSVQGAPSPSPNPLVIASKPSLNVTNTTVIVFWTTNLKSSTIVEYGADENYGKIEKKDDNVTKHSINIIGLSYLTSYHFRAISCIGDLCLKSNDTNATIGHRQCLPAMSYIPQGDFCMDNFENIIQEGKAISIAASVPFSNVARSQAQSACEAVGKRLCTSDEFTAACNLKGVKFGNIGSVCNLQNFSYIPAGFAQNCTSSEGVHDLVGNLWEWVSDTTSVNTPRYSGLVERDDILTAGVDYHPPQQFNSETEKRGSDYYFNVEINPQMFSGKGVTRGGYYGSNQGGGCFAYQVGVPLEGDPKVGFRCCAQ